MHANGFYTAMTRTEPGARQYRSAGGFTLGETMVGLFIFMIIMAGLLTVFTMSMLAWKEGSRDINLQSAGRLIIEKLMRGPGGRFGLRESAEDDVTVDNDGKGITFSVDKNDPPTFSKDDDTEARFYFQSERMMYDPSTGIVGDEVPVLARGRVEDVQFQQNGKALTINLWLTETSQTTHPSHVQFQTKVFLRRSGDPDSET